MDEPMANSSMFALHAIIAPASRSRSGRGGFERRAVAFENPRAAGRRMVQGDDVVLDRDRHAVPAARARHRLDSRALGLERSCDQCKTAFRGAALVNRPVSGLLPPRFPAVPLPRSLRPPSRRAAVPRRTRPANSGAISAGGRARATGASTSSRSGAAAGPGMKRLAQRISRHRVQLAT